MLVFLDVFQRIYDYATIGYGMLLKSELLDIEDLIFSTLEKVPDRSALFAPPDLSVLRKLCDRARNNWTTRIFSAAKDHVISRYVVFHQAGITRLSDLVDATIQESVGPKNSLFQEMLVELEKLLVFLRHCCYRYFDIDYQVSAYAVRQEKTAISGYLRQISESPVQDAARELLTIVCTDVQDFMEEGVITGVSYRRLSRVSGLLVLMLNELSSQDKASAWQLIRILFKRNLNSHRFVNWLRRYYELIIEASESSGPQEAEALFDIYVNPDERFIKELPGIDQQLLPWLRLQ